MDTDSIFENNFYKVVRQPLIGYCSISVLILNVVAPIMRYTKHFDLNKVKDIPCDVGMMRKYLGHKFNNGITSFINTLNTYDSYISSERYYEILDDMFSDIQYISMETKAEWRNRYCILFREDKVNPLHDVRLIIKLTMPMIALCVRYFLVKCSKSMFGSLIDVADTDMFLGLQESNISIRIFKHPGYSSLFVEEDMLKDNVVIKMCIAHDFVNVHHNRRLSDGRMQEDFTSYIRRLPVLISESRGHICDQQWEYLSYSIIQNDYKYIPTKFPECIDFTPQQLQQHVMALEFVTKQSPDTSNNLDNLLATISTTIQTSNTPMNDSLQQFYQELATLKGNFTEDHPVFQNIARVVEWFLDNRHLMPFPSLQSFPDYIPISNNDRYVPNNAGMNEVIDYSYSAQETMADIPLVMDGSSMVKQNIKLTRCQRRHKKRRIEKAAALLAISSSTSIQL
jgi:hypothetical protein